MNLRNTAQKTTIINQSWKITEAIWSMICKIGAKRTDSNSCPVRGVEEMTDTSQSSGGVGIEVR